MSVERWGEREFVRSMCPFCRGKKAYLQEQTFEEDDAPTFYVRCTRKTCGAIGPLKMTPVKARLAWNRWGTHWDLQTRKRTST